MNNKILINQIFETHHFGNEWGIFIDIEKYCYNINNINMTTNCLNNMNRYKNNKKYISGLTPIDEHTIVIDKNTPPNDKQLTDEEPIYEDPIYEDPINKKNIDHDVCVVITTTAMITCFITYFIFL